MKYLKAVMALSLITFSYGCGGPHVTGSDPASSGSGDSESSTSATNVPDPDVVNPPVPTPPTPPAPDEPDEEVVIQEIVDQPPVADGGNGGAGGAGGSGTQGGNGAAGAPGANGVNGAPGPSAPIVAAEETPVLPSTIGIVEVITPPPGINGINGATGPRGRDGRDADNVAFPTLVSGLAPGELANAAATFNLPYLLREAGDSRDHLGLYNLGQGRRNNGRGEACDGSLPSCSVRDGMVLFHVRVPLPARNSIIAAAPFSAVMTLNIRKLSLSNPAFDATEMLCWLDAGTCSGNYFMTLDEERTAGLRVGDDAFDWHALINPVMSGGPAVTNTTFGDDLHAGAATSRAQTGRGRTGSIHFRSQALPIDLAHYFRRGEQDLTRDELMDLLYGNSDPAVAPTDRILTFLVADDVMVLGADLKMTYSWERSDSSTPAVSAE